VEEWETHVPKAQRASFGPLLDAVLVGELTAARRLFSPLEKGFLRGGRKRAAAVRWCYSLIEEPSKLRKWGSSKMAGRGRLPSEKRWLSWAMEYPPAYRLLIETMARKVVLPPYFFYSIMRQESRYRRGVVSWADAVGLLQVIPSTGRETAKRLGMPFSRRTLPTPEVNIRLGVGYLGLLSRDMRRQLVFVAASYNAGPEPVRKFLGESRDRNLDFAVEEIAYNEARNYCRKVSGHVVNYLALYTPREARQEVLEQLLPSAVDYDIGTEVRY